MCGELDVQPSVRFMTEHSTDVFSALSSLAPCQSDVLALPPFAEAHIALLITLLDQYPSMPIPRFQILRAKGSASEQNDAVYVFFKNSGGVSMVSEIL